MINQILLFLKKINGETFKYLVLRSLFQQQLFTEDIGERDTKCLLRPLGRGLKIRKVKQFPLTYKYVYTNIYEAMFFLEIHIYL